MIAYHYTVVYTGFASLEADYQRKSRTVEPYIRALAHGDEVFAAMLLMGMYKDRVLRSEREDGWFEYAKDATEAVFEVVRRREFPQAISRLHCTYYVDTLEGARRLGISDWGEDPALRILEVELDAARTVRLDQTFYNNAYDRMTDYRSYEDLYAAMAQAREYFSGAMSDTPLPELLSDGENRIISVHPATN